jgi:hypothetical protein
MRKGRGRIEKNPRKTSSNESLTNERLGRLAQNCVATWADRSGLNYSVSNPDLDGWDFQLSLPTGSKTDTYYDIDPGRPCCFAQVKGTKTSKRRRQITLNHWHFAATIPVPWYYIVIEYDTEDAAQGLFVVPMDKTLIEKVARRLREKGAREAFGESIPLHKQTMDLVWDEAHRVECSASGLLDALVVHAGADPGEYARKKTSWWKGAGADSLRYFLSAYTTGPLDGAYSMFSDWALGFREDVTVRDLTATEVRWDIERKLPEAPGESRLSFQQHPTLGATTMTISSQDALDHATIDIDIYCNVSVFGFLPRPYWALRLKSEFLSILLPAVGNIKLSYAVPAGQPATPLRILAEVARAVRITQKSWTLEFSVTHRDKLTDYTHHLDPAPKAEALDELFVLETAWDLAKSFGLPTDCMVRPGDLFKETEHVRAFHELQSSTHGTDLEVRLLHPDGDKPGDHLSFLYFCRQRLGDYDLILAILVEGLAEKDGEQLRVRARPRTLERWSLGRPFTGKVRKERFVALVRPLYRRLLEEGIQDLRVPPGMGDLLDD